MTKIQFDLESLKNEVVYWYKELSSAEDMGLYLHAEHCTNRWENACAVLEEFQFHNNVSF